MKRVMFCIFAVLLGLLQIMAVPCPASAGDDSLQKAAQARSELEVRVNEVLALVQDDTLKADPVIQEKKLYDKAFEIFDFNTFSMLALGRKYRDFSPAQRQEFITWFSRLISNTYFPKLAGQDVASLKVVYEDVLALPPVREVFKTDITTQLVTKDTKVSIVYRMIQANAPDWKIYDIKIEGVSMAANYRAQFKEDLSLSPEQIITHLREKVEK